MKAAAIPDLPADDHAPRVSNSPALPSNESPRHTIPPAPPNAPLMTRNDVAAVLRTTPRQVSNMAARGQLPASVRVDGLGVRWRRVEIDAWIATK